VWFGHSSLSSEQHNQEGAISAGEFAKEKEKWSNHIKKTKKGGTEIPLSRLQKEGATPQAQTPLTSRRSWTRVPFRGKKTLNQWPL